MTANLQDIYVAFSNDNELWVQVQQKVQHLNNIKHMEDIDFSLGTSNSNKRFSTKNNTKTYERKYFWGT